MFHIIKSIVQFILVKYVDGLIYEVEIILRQLDNRNSEQLPAIQSNYVMSEIFYYVP